MRYLLSLLLLSGCAWACGTAPTKLFFSNSASSATSLTAQTLVTASGTEVSATTAKTAKTTSTAFQMKAGTANTSSAADSSSPVTAGWNNDVGSIPSGCSIPSGTWTVSSLMSDGSGSQTNAILSAHIDLCTGTLASLTTANCVNKCNFTNATVSMSTSAATKTASATCGQIDFVANSFLYVVIWYTSGSSNSSTSTTATTVFRSLGSTDFVSFPHDITTPAASQPHQLLTLGVGD